MLVELKKSRLAEELAGANESILKLLRQAAAAVEVSYEEAMDGWGHPGKPAREKVDAVLALALRDRISLANAVAADLEYEAGDDGFEFEFSQLEADARKAGKELMGSMYSDVFGRGSFLFSNGEEANRRTWEEAFRDANPDLHVCPACLASLLETRIENRSAIDLDHYLPKSLYPPLSVHGPNLVPLCSRCNSRAKGEKDPLEDEEGRRSLKSVWLPYTDAGLEEAHIAFELTGDSHATARLQGRGDGGQRAENFDSLYLVSKTWSEELIGIHNGLCAEISVRGAQRGAPLNSEEIMRELEIKVTAAAQTRLLRPNSFLTESYCRWLQSSRPAFEAFLRVVQSFPPPPTASPGAAV